MRLVPENHPTREVGFASARALSEWNAAMSGELELMARELDRLTHRPLDRGQNPRRTHPLRPPLDKKTIGAVALPLWQQEITASGRLWYCPDKSTLRVWVVKVSLRHPKETD